MGHFAKTLTRLRVEAGFQTPYAYYHRNGGRRVFPFSFAYYLKLERGAHLPRPEWLPVLLSLLRIPPSDALCRRFVTDFLKDLFVTEENYQSLIAPFLAPPAKAAHDQQTVKRLLSEQAYHLTPEQYLTIVGDEATYWAFEVLVNDRGAFSAPEIAEITGLPAARVEVGLRKLVARKLAQKAAKGRYKSPLAAKFYMFPRQFPGIEEGRRKVAKIIDAMVARRGAVLHESGIMLRAEEGALHRAVSAFRDAMESATAYSVYEKGEGSGIFFLQTRVRKALDF